MAMTPMMQQYHEAKNACGDAILLFRMGDFYELFNDDAVTASKVLGMTLTSRDKGENATPMAGFPHHQLDSYLAKLIQQGYRVGICDQVEDPKQAKGIVKREITRILSPGTLTDDSLLSPKESNFLAAVLCEGDHAGISWIELSTGRFLAGVFSAARLADELARIAPSECLLSEGTDALPKHMNGQFLQTQRPAWAFGGKSADEKLSKHFEIKSLDGFGFEEGDRLAIRAAGAILDYLQETQRGSLEHLQTLIPYRQTNAVEIDESTRRSLELTRTIRDQRRDGTLISILDRCRTPMGSRLMADWLGSPLASVQPICERHDAVEELKNDLTLSEALGDALAGVYDLQRLLTRVTTGRASPRDLSFVGRTLAKLPRIKAKVTSRKSKLLGEIEGQIDLCPEVHDKLAAALIEDCPLTTADGGFIQDGYNAKLDELRGLAAGGKQWIANYQAEESKKSGIPNMKVGFNKVFGYYIEITNAHREKVPTYFHRKQTLKNAERYITPELKEYEEKVLSADEKAKTLEYDLFAELRDLVQAAADRLRGTATALANLDALVSLGNLARDRNYCRPKIDDGKELAIVDGRHPVLDVTEEAGTFIPNDTMLGGEDADDIAIITGPNMAGKSTYIRQVGLIAIMAQMGSFVPAKEARVGIVDRVFARVGASDELSRGQSTFMVEMTETARILNTATERSLVILDEIGRGTSTYDGVSLAWSIVEYIHDRIGCRTLFATHYHELADLSQSLDRVTNLNVAVKEWDDKIIFLHKIVAGAADKSYGIYVARLAGIPNDVNERAKQILTQLEQEHLDLDGQSKIRPKRDRHPKTDLQLTLFGPSEHPVVEEIRQTDLSGLTPLDAFQKLIQWQSELKKPVN
ncbi:DNA mismatch repair protein MutS [Bremerella volcania]|uniref:DNA mismatch repair protein MutS n=2 Tax=Bremerella volcania TaxID=2527984 RepID=A0A518CB59_9BACT|nr:DNA mismatch repair protein MutS [Bremerella volcania]